MKILKRVGAVVLIFVLVVLSAAGCSVEQLQPPAEPPDGIYVPPSSEPEIEQPPSEKKVREIDGLVVLTDLDESIVVDLRYATADNFTGQVIYPAAVAVLKRETAEKLVRANQIFQEHGYTIKVWDAYRPLSAQAILWQAFPDSRYVIKPEDPPPVSGFRARHNNGMSVDLTLVDRFGNELEMPSAFDDFSEKAWPDSPDMSAAARQNLDLLRSVMESVGFAGVTTEWWHYNDVSGTPAPYQDIPLEAFLEPEPQ